MSTIIFDDYRNVTPQYKELEFDLAVCDIPYGIDVANMAFLKEAKHLIKQKNGSRLNANAKKKTYQAKNWDKEVSPQAYFDELKRISRHQIIFGVEYVNWNGLGSGRIKWNKGVAEGVSFKKYEMAYEKGKKKVMNFVNQGDFFKTPLINFLNKNHAPSTI